MSSSNGKAFTGTVIGVLALFGIGGYLADKSRNSDEELQTEQTSQATGPGQTMMSPQSSQAGPDVLSSGNSKQPVANVVPDFEIVNLANDGTGTIAGKAMVGARVILDIDGKSEKMGDVSSRGDFSLDLEEPLSDGKHILKLKSVGPKKMAPLMSDRSIEVTLNKDKDIVVALLEKGQPRRVLQGVDEDAEQESSVKEKAEKPHQATEKLPTQSEDKTKTSAPEPKIVQLPEEPADKPEWKDLSFGEMKYVDGLDGKKGEINITGTSQAGAKLRFLMDGEKIGTTKAGATGAWNFATRRDLSPGSHWLVTEQIDDKGNVIVKAEAPFDRAEPVAKKADELSGKLATKAKAVEEELKKAGKDAKDGPQKMADAGADAKKTAGDRASKAEKSASQAVDEIAGKAEKTADAGLKSGAAKGQNKDGEKGVWGRFTDIFKVDGDKKAGAGPSKSNAGPSKPKESGEQGVASAEGASTGDEKRPSMTSSPFAFDSVGFEGQGEKGEITLTGHAEPGARIRLFEGSREIGEVDTNDKGIWAFTKKGAVRSGTHLYRAGYILKNGRIAAEARMQYDHTGETKMAGADPDNMQMSGNREAGSSMKAKGSAAKNLRRASSKKVKRQKGRRVKKSRRRTASLRSRKSTKRRRHRSKRKTRRARGQVYNKTDRRYYLRGRNKSRYLARRKLYPRSRATPAKVRVRRGTTLWGYSEHYYGKGRYYKRIYRANKRRIGRNPHVLRPGLKIRVPKVRKKRRKRK